ncbi:hypothetical protein EJB05_11896, partial [Eragrostis curvula]
MDHISGLPDELLHAILVRLRSARAAARTSLLSHRWRCVWAELPELVLGTDDAQPPGSLADSIDAAIAAYAAAAVERLEIAMPSDIRVSARGIAPWLRFASHRLVGTLDLRVQCQDNPTPKYSRREEEQEVELPVCRRATRITLFLGQERCSSCLRPAAGSFAALTYLAIHDTSMEARALDALLSSQCPRLENLDLHVTLVAASDVSLRSDSLISLWYHAAKTRRLQIVAARMEKLWISRDIEAHTISAPKLAEFWVDCARVVYYPHQDLPVNAERRVLLLDVGDDSSPSLFGMFNKVDELKLSICIYMRRYHEGFTPTMLHLLRKCNSIKKFTVTYCHSGYSTLRRASWSLQASDITLNSLEEVEIEWTSGSFQEIEFFVRHLSKCTATLLEKVVIDCTSHRTSTLTNDVRERLSRMCSPNFIVEFNVTNSSVDEVN